MPKIIAIGESLYDPNFRPSAHKSPEGVIPLITENIGYASLLRASDEDMWHMFQVKDGKSAYEKVRKLGIRWFIYTLNKDGALLYTPQKELSFPSREIQPFSTIGAGDGFNAGLIHGLYRHHVTHNGLSRLTDTDWYTMLNLAIMFAAHVCLQAENYISRDFADKVIQREEAGPYT